MKDALDQNDTLVEAGPDAPQVATSPAFGGIVDLCCRIKTNSHSEAV